jgi:NADH-quinone oxidoreductase subunit M
MQGWPLLSLTTFVPLIGAAFILLIRGEAAVVARNARNVALWTSLITLVLALMVWANFDPKSAAFQMEERAAWIPGLGLTYHMGVDGISVFFVVLSAFLTPLCVLASWKAITERVREFMLGFLVLETLMIGMFCALDIVLFYLFFEGVLIPMFLIIGIWGGPRRVYSAFKFFLYTLAGSVLMLVAILAMAFTAGTTNIPELMKFSFAEGMQMWLWRACC